MSVDAEPDELFYAFDPDGGHGYVWHCHIIDHEDNEMIRPTSVQANEGVERSYVMGEDHEGWRGLLRQPLDAGSGAPRAIGINPLDDKHLGRNHQGG